MLKRRSKNKLDRDFELAKEQGRWLSDEEYQSFEQNQDLRSKLLVLTGVCIVLPPLWPLAFLLTLYLLFPKTISRIGVVATVFLLLSSLVVIGILILLLVGLFNVVF